MALFLSRRGDTNAAQEELARIKTAPAAAENPTVHYRAVLTYEQLGQREKALEALSEALRVGYSLEQISKDPELVDLRQDVRYHRVLLKHSEKEPLESTTP